MCPPEHYNLIEKNSPLFIGQFHGLVDDIWGERDWLAGYVLFLYPSVAQKIDLVHTIT